MRRGVRVLVAVSLLSILVTAYQNCSPAFKPAKFADSNSNEPNSINHSNRLGDLSNPFQCGQTNSPAITPLRRLTFRELQNTLVDLFAGQISLAEIEGELSLLPKETVVDVPARRLFDTSYPAPINSLLVEAYDKVASRIADLIALNPTRLTAVVGSTCGTQATVTDVCVSDFIRKFGLRALRRPPSADEVLLYLTLFRTGTSGSDGFARVIQALLQAPHFLYHLNDNGTPASSGAPVLDLSPYEVANRLSYLLIGSMPDTPLFDAAANGSLSNEAGVTTQVKRLLGTNKARTGLRDFYSQWLRLDKVAQVNSTAAFADGIDPVGFQSEARQEIITLMDSLIWNQNANYQTLLTTKLISPNGPNIAKAYGVTASNQLVESTAPERRGLFTRAGLLAINPGGTTSPIKRGVRMRFNLLCNDIGIPASAALQQAVQVDPLTSTRTQTEVKTSPAACIGCHAMINPLGFAFENYDAFGRFRNQEVVTSEGQSATWPINSAIQPNIQSMNEPMIHGAVELQELMTQSYKGPACLARQFLSYGVGRLSSEQDSCILKPMYDALIGNGGSILKMIEAMALSKEFRQKKLN